jgi:predicted nucleic acid-binding protein
MIKLEHKEEVWFMRLNQPVNEFISYLIRKAHNSDMDIDKLISFIEKDINLDNLSSSQLKGYEDLKREIMSRRRSMDAQYSIYEEAIYDEESK